MFFVSGQYLELATSYGAYIPRELQRLPIWLPCIQRQPLFPFSGEHKKNLVTLEKVLNKLSDNTWLAKRRDYYVETKGDKFKKGLVHLAAVFTDTDYCYLDPDHRWLLDDNGEKLLGEDGKKLGNKDSFDQDQIDAMAVIRGSCPGWKSWSGQGFHGLMRRSDKIIAIDAAKVNTLVGGKFLAPFELKFHTCFLPPCLEPINDLKAIPQATPFVEDLCQRIAKYKSKSKTIVSIPSDIAVDSTTPTIQSPPLEQAISKGGKETSPAPAPAATVIGHNDRERLLDQYCYLNSQGRKFIPDGHAEYGAWHRRLTTMGFTKDKIKTIAKSQLGFVDGKDDDDIDNSDPYPDGEKQARIEFKRVKDIFNRFNFNVADAKDYRARVKQAKADSGIVDWNALVRPEAIGKFAPRGEIALLAARAGTGKSCLTLARIAEISKQGYRSLYLSGDMNLVDMRPHLMANGTVSKNFRAIDDLTLLTAGWLNTIMHEYQPDLIVMDSFIDCLSCLASEFMYDHQTKKMGKFDPNSDPMTWVKVFGWLKPFARHWNVSIFGMVHPAKERFGHDLPHSSKLQGYLHRWDILYRKGSNMKGFQYGSVVSQLEQSPEGTRLEWNGKRRRNTERMHTMYGLQEVNTDLLHHDDRNEKIMTMTNVKEYADVEDLLRDSDDDYYHNDHVGQGLGEVFNLSSDEPTPDDQKPPPPPPTLKDAQRRDHIDEEEVYDTVCRLKRKNTSDDWVTLIAIKQSLARHDEAKQFQIDEHLKALANRKIIYRKTSGRGYKVRLNPDQDYSPPPSK